MRRTSQKLRRNGWLALAAVLVAGAVILWRQHPHPDHLTPPPAGKISAATNTGSNVPSAAELSRRETRFASFQQHPFGVSRESARFNWTAEDGKDPGVIRQLAHNELEFQRMTNENDRIYQRQLVYLKETPAMLLERAKADGQTLQQLTLPGLDGQEIQVEIAQSDLNPSGQLGTFAGHIAGRLDSSVTLAFKGGREAYTVLSPSDHLYLVGEPREPGELIVKSINPDTYVVGVCGNP